jgi:hypothetical protein
VFSTQGLLATASFDGSVGVWDPTDATLLVRIPCATLVYCCSWSSTRPRLLAAGGRSLLILFDVPSGQTVQSVPVPADVMCCAFAPQDQWLAAGCSDEWSDDLLNAAPMHDVGKIGIPDAILLKNGPLTAEEWTVMRRHPQIGAEIIGEHDSQVLQMAYIIALTHHEKWDGTGYPRGLAGEDIPLASRIVAVADVFDALTTERPYKHAWTVDDAMAHIEQQAGAHFDPRLVPLFIGLRPQLEDIRERWKD